MVSLQPRSFQHESSGPPNGPFACPSLRPEARDCPPVGQSLRQRSGVGTEAVKGDPVSLSSWQRSPQTSSFWEPSFCDPKKMCSTLTLGLWSGALDHLAGCWACRPMPRLGPLCCPHPQAGSPPPPHTELTPHFTMHPHTPGPHCRVLGAPREPASAQQAWDREGVTRSQLGATAGVGLESSRP